MYCANCAAPITSTLSYCNRCGASLRQTPQPTNTGAMGALLTTITLIAICGMAMMLGGGLALKAAGFNQDFIAVFMGMKVRLKASFDISTFSPHIQVILRAFKKYGLILADNGSNWYFSGAPDMRWSDNELNALKTLKGSNFEVVKMNNMLVSSTLRIWNRQLAMTCGIISAEKSP